MLHGQIEARMLLTAGDAARLVGRHPSTIKLAADLGHLPIAARTPGNVRLFLEADVRRWAQRRAAARR